MDRYKLSEGLNEQIENEFDGADVLKRIAVFKEIAKQIFPTLKNSALMIGDKVELFTHD